MTFTHNEALWGLPARSRQVQDFVERSAAEKSWLFGVHIQGDCSHLRRWPLQEWQSFVLWPDLEAPFLSQVPRDRLLGLNCINFMPDVPLAPAGMTREIDLCIIARASTIKRIHETLLVLRRLLDLKPDLSATIVVPDPRDFALGEKSYEKQGIDRRFFNLPLRLFSARELRQLSFICSAEASFGCFPVSRSLLADILHRSRFLLLLSHQEGTPRVIAEALQAGTPCIVSEALKSGIRDRLNARNSLFVSDDVATAAAQIRDALAHYDRFAVDTRQARAAFCAEAHLPRFKAWLESKIAVTGKPVEGAWYLDDLYLRLACHGERHNSQFMNRPTLFFDWLSKIDPPAGASAADPYDEDALLGIEPLDDRPFLSDLAIRQVQRVAGGVKRRLRTLLLPTR